MELHAGNVCVFPIAIRFRRFYQQRITPFRGGKKMLRNNGVSFQRIVHSSMSRIVDGAALSVIDQRAQKVVSLRKANTAESLVPQSHPSDRFRQVTTKCVPYPLGDEVISAMELD